MTAPWNVRVTPGHVTEFRRLSQSKPDWWHIEVRWGRKWIDAGTADSWLEGFLLGLLT